MNPQEKKVRDYCNQRKNCYGENDKSSRRALRRKKKVFTKSSRAKVRGVFSSYSSIDELDSDISSVQRKRWKKYPDRLIFKALDNKWSGSRFRDLSHSGKHREQALKRLHKAGKPIDK